MLGEQSFDKDLDSMVSEDDAQVDLTDPQREELVGRSNSSSSGSSGDSSSNGTYSSNISSSSGSSSDSCSSNGTCSSNSW